tara:strand:- start:1922 stop:2689 length:768 start_codon:yes stop_codon:yes gene_type:complete
MISFFEKIENFFLYHPRQLLDSSPEGLGIKYENVKFTAKDNTKLHGWFFPPNSSDNPVILWAHGNAGNISHRIENILLMRKFLDVGIFIFDYRGYGLSEGKPNEKGLYSDMEGAYLWLANRISENRIVLFGRSLGAAVATKLSIEKTSSQSLILESPFENTIEMGKKIFPFLPLGWLIKQKYDTKAIIHSVKIPLLILHGDKDTIVPFQQGKNLFDFASGPKQFFKIKGAGHNDTYSIGGTFYWETWKKFLQKYN